MATCSWVIQVVMPFLAHLLFPVSCCYNLVFWNLCKVDNVCFLLSISGKVMLKLLDFC